MTEARIPWQQLLTEQHGLASTAQLLSCGITPQQLRHRVQSGRWQQVLHGVHSVTNGPLVRPAALSAALLFGGPDALLSHRTAAQEWGMVRGDPGPVHITVPYGRSAVSQPATLRATGPRYRQPVVDPGAVVHPCVVGIGTRSTWSNPMRSRPLVASPRWSSTGGRCGRTATTPDVACR
jgi:hypothetical protein